MNSTNVTSSLNTPINTTSTWTSQPITTISSGTATIGNSLINNSSYGYSTGSWYNSFETIDYTDLALNLEKLGTMETNIKELVITLFDKLCSSNTSSNEKKLIFNTIDSYHLFADMKSLKRKNKIQSALKQ